VFVQIENVSTVLKTS